MENKMSHPMNKKWEETDFSDGQFKNCLMERVKFTHGVFHGAAFNRFVGEEMTFRMSNMQRSQFLNVNLVGAYVNGCNLSNMRVENNKWSDMRMDDCKVYGLEFENGILEDTTVRSAKIKNLNLENCDISGLRINGILIDDLIIQAEELRSRCRSDR